jgi:hypothetical protein
MIKEIFAIYDVKTEAYGQPYFANTKGEAIRAFSDIINDITHPLGKHPEDFSLYLIGNYNDKNATLEKLQQPKELGKGLDFVDKDFQEYLELKNNKTNSVMQAPTILKEQAQ